MTPYRHGVWLLAAALSGCLVSEEPLISDADSVTPLEDGTYRYGYVQDDSEEDVVVSHSGGVTIMTVVGDDSSETGMRIAKLRRGYYVLMSGDDDARYMYWLMRVDRGRATLYDTDDNCSRLKELWLVDGKTPADVGIAASEGTVVSTCAFTRYKDLARAFRDLLADGKLEPAVVIEPK